MGLRIQRRPLAAKDAEEIAAFIAKNSLQAAIRFLENAKQTLELLAESPGIGSQFESDHSELANLRFRRVRGFPNHVIFSFERTDAIEVVRILHGARDLESALKQG